MNDVSSLPSLPSSVIRTNAFHDALGTGHFLPRPRSKIPQREPASRVGPEAWRKTARTGPKAHVLACLPSSLGPFYRHIASGLRKSKRIFDNQETAVRHNMPSHFAIVLASTPNLTVEGRPEQLEATGLTGGIFSHGVTPKTNRLRTSKTHRTIHRQLSQPSSILPAA